MAFRTRVWSAGKLLLLVGALCSRPTSCLRRRRCASRSRAREVQVPDLTNRTANEATAIAGRPRPRLKVDDTRRPDPKIAAGRVLAQDPPAGIDGAPAAQRPGVAERRPARGHRAGADRRDRADGAAAADAGRPRRWPTVSEIRSRRLPVRRRRRAGPAGQERRPQRRAARQPRPSRRPTT